MYKELVAESQAFETSQQAQLSVAELELEQSRFEETRAKAGAERMVVLAPRAGMVVIRELTRDGEFDTIRTGDELRHGQPYLDIVAPGPMIVEARANQVDIKDLHIGDWATVVPEAYPDISARAQVIAIGSMAVSRRLAGQLGPRGPGQAPNPQSSTARLMPSLTVTVDLALDSSTDDD